ncbi:MAG TPA: hypothetical protein VNE39_05025 [Planctomycetota bacterium]|nr:hypothetical protein [Planctomycetota bacterium]
MKRTTKAVLIVVGGSAIVAAAFVLSARARRPAEVHKDDTLPPPPKAVPAPMRFANEGLPARIIESLEHVVRPGRAQAAVWPRKAPLWFCVVVDGKQRYYELDRGMKVEHFGGLTECSFQPLPPAMGRTTSIYRAVARRAVPEFNEDHGDRILILLCPRDDWPKLSLQWPPLPASPK